MPQTDEIRTFPPLPPPGSEVNAGDISSLLEAGSEATVCSPLPKDVENFLVNHIKLNDIFSS